MRVWDGVRKTVVFIGCKSSRGFVPYGTGFIAENQIEGLSFQNIVTAKHVIDSIPGETVYVRVNRKVGDAEIAVGPKAGWHFHPSDKVDVAVCPMNLSTEIFDIATLPMHGEHILTEELIDEYDIGTGNEVFVAGMFTSRLGDTKNIPIIRTGNIAAMPEEPIRTEYGAHHAYLIEARSIDGLSGSPVLVHRSPIQLTEDGQLKFQYGMMQLLLGMLLGHNPVTNPGDTVQINPNSDGLAKTGEEVLIPWNTGIAVVIPISYVLEAVNQPEIERMRRTVMGLPAAKND